MAPSLSGRARDSVALRIVAERLPPPTIVAGRLLALLDTTGLPPLFAGFEPAPAPPVDLPADAEARALAQSAIASTARIASTGCGDGAGRRKRLLRLGDASVVTNAHVVAGSNRYDRHDRRRRSTSRRWWPSIPAPTWRCCTSRVPRLRAAAERGRRPTRGTTGRGARVSGRRRSHRHAGGGDRDVRAGGPDIYGEGLSERSVVEMRAQIRRGNSGGPLVIAPGVVGGRGLRRLARRAGRRLRHRRRPGARTRLGPAIGSTTAVDTGACL